MSELREALELIARWVQRNRSNHPAVMNPGLSRDAIETKAKKLPFQLPEEVYELYQWHNGGRKPFIPYPDGWDLASFLPLEEAISTFQDWKISENLFLLFMIEDCGYFIVGTQEKVEVAPIYFSDTLGDVLRQKPRYSSLTSMMQELVEELRNSD